MEWKNTISFLLVFLIAFALGYLIDVPNEIDVNFKVDDNTVKMTENMQNLTYNCPACECVCAQRDVTYPNWHYIDTYSAEGD